MHMVSRVGWILSLGLVVACGGVSEQRVDALEAQIEALRETQTQQQGPSTVELQEKIDTAQATTAASIEKLEQTIVELQQHAAAEAAQPEQPPVAGPWGDVAEILGVEQAGVQVEGDSYTVGRAWLLREVRAVALAGRSPRFIAGKKGGVVVRGIRPKSLLAQLGIANNDAILAVGEQAVSTPAELYAALRAASSPVTVKIQRRKKERALQYTVAD